MRSSRPARTISNQIPARTRDTTGCTSSTGDYVWYSAIKTSSSPPGEVAEFDTHLPHWFGNADAQPVEFLSILGPQGERFHIGARYRRD